MKKGMTFSARNQVFTLSLSYIRPGVLMLLLSLLLAGCEGSISTVSHSAKPLTRESLGKGNWGKYLAARVYRNQPYGWDKTHPERLTFDLYRPEGVTGNLPLILFVHSGAFIQGDKENFIISRYCEDFARTGQFATASINYRILDRSHVSDLQNMAAAVSKGFTRKKIFEAVGDVRRAVRYFKENPDQLDLGIDPDNIFLVGFSAGGIIANHLLFTDAEEAREYITENGVDRLVSQANGFLGGKRDPYALDNRDYFASDMTEALRGVVSIGGGILTHKHVQDTELGDTRLLLIHGDQDKMVPIDRDRPFLKYAKDTRIPLGGFFFDIGIEEKRVTDLDSLRLEWGMNGTGKGGLLVLEEFIRLFIKVFTSDLCGSRCLFEEIQVSGNCKLVEFQGGPHVFMLNQDGLFNESYRKSRNLIRDFIRSNLRS